METAETFDRYADELLVTASMAAARFRQLDQEQVDRIVEAVYHAAYDNRLELARQALDETGAGVFEHKVVKNAWASLLVYEDIRARKTVGRGRPRSRDRDHGDRAAEGTGSRDDPGHEPDLDGDFQDPDLHEDAKPRDPEPARRRAEVHPRDRADSRRGRRRGRRSRRGGPDHHEAAPRRPRPDHAPSQARADPRDRDRRDRASGAEFRNADLRRRTRQRARLRRSHGGHRARRALSCTFQDVRQRHGLRERAGPRRDRGDRRAHARAVDRAGELLLLDRRGEGAGRDRIRQRRADDEGRRGRPLRGVDRGAVRVHASPRGRGS